MKSYLYIFITILFVSCQIDEAYDYQSARDLLVMNSLLSPDSIISISLTHAGDAPFNEEEFQIVEQANIEVFENGIFLGVAEYNENAKIYILDYYPSAGKTYTIVTNMGAYPTLKATTGIPLRPDISGCYTLFDKKTECTGCQYTQANLFFKDIEPESKFWISSFSDHFARRDDGSLGTDSSTVERKSFGGLYSTSILLDQFNAIQDRGYIQYNVYMRLEVQEKKQRTFSIDIVGLGAQWFYNYREIQTLDPRLGLYMVVMAASEEFDRYMKDVVTNFNNDTDIIDDVPNPFSERIDVYSNVENGLGIIAGYNPIIIPIHKNKCEQ